MIYVYDADAVAIRNRLQSGAPLVACLCTQRCHKCDDWWGDFSTLSQDFSDACFVWIDSDEHPDMVADIPGLNAFPFLLIQTPDAVQMLETVVPDIHTVRNALQLHLSTETTPAPSLPEPGCYSFLLEE